MNNSNEDLQEFPLESHVGFSEARPEAFKFSDEDIVGRLAKIAQEGKGSFLSAHATARLSALLSPTPAAGHAHEAAPAAAKQLQIQADQYALSKGLVPDGSMLFTTAAEGFEAGYLATPAPSSSGVGVPAADEDYEDPGFEMSDHALEHWFGKDMAATIKEGAATASLEASGGGAANNVARWVPEIEERDVVGIRKGLFPNKDFQSGWDVQRVIYNGTFWQHADFAKPLEVKVQFVLVEAGMPDFPTAPQATATA